MAMDSYEQGLSLAALTWDSQECDSFLTWSELTESLKRPRSGDIDGVEEVGPPLKRYSNAAPEQSREERPNRTIYFPENGIMSIRKDCDDEVDTDLLMTDCSVGYEAVEEALGVEETSMNQVETCFGTIVDVKVAFLDDNRSDSSHGSMISTDREDVQRFAVCSREECYYLQSSDRTDFAVMHSRTATALQTLQDLKSLRFEAILTGGDLTKPHQVSKEGKKTVFAISITIYGPDDVSQEVGKRLSRVRTYLQHPICVRKDVPYNNPHFYVITGVQKAETQYISPSSEKEDQQTPLVDISKVLEEIEQARRLPSLDVDWRVKTPLLEHQKEALCFIVQRETASIKNELSLWKAQANENGRFHYEHTITGSRRLTEPVVPRGGVLADDIGLGKTLTMISAIVMSLDMARAFMHPQDHISRDGDLQSLRRTSSTLVIAPSVVLLDGWRDEIQRHVDPGTLTVYKYHSIGKEVDVESMIAHDIVLTTYATLASDIAKRSSPLNHILWFRVILDEAHVVRRQTTQQFRAVYSLHAEIRWCLSGTLIHNRIEDLGSLIRFLRIDPFDNNVAFRTHISEPLLTDPKAGDQSLRLLLRSICLRRTRVLLDIPEAEDQTITLFPSTAERNMYSQIIEDTKRDIDNCISSRLISKAYSGIVHTILRLRLLCNHGTPQCSPNKSGLQGQYLEEQSTKEVKLVCAFCSCEILTSDGQNDASPGTSPRSPFQLLCPACLLPNEVRHTGYENDPDKNRFSRSRSSQRVEEADAISFNPRNMNQTDPRSLQQSMPYFGHSSKLTAIINNLQAHRLGNKSIVFSCWKKTLDLLQLMLQNANIHHVRIDGDTSTKERERIIKRFQEDPNTDLLLMTTGTGAEGLNLTTATRVHLVEPQWNPAVESQAIGRALRLGQTRTVTIIRYVMERTIEEAIQSRQIMKLQLAELTLEKSNGNGNGSEGIVLKRLKDLRSLLHKY